MDVPCADLRCGGRQHFSISLGRLSTGLLERRPCAFVANACLQHLIMRSVFFGLASIDIYLTVVSVLTVVFADNADALRCTLLSRGDVCQQMIA
eukprot:scaffold150806_cov26-Tisochrysis_lutea.AAC.1